MKNKVLILTAFIFCASRPTSYGVDLVSYEFTDDRLSPTSVLPGITASDFSSPVFSFATGTNDLRTSETLGLADGAETVSDNMTNAVNANQYVAFTVTANSGFVLNLDALAFDIRRGLRGTQDYAVKSSADTFATYIVFANNVINDTSVRRQSIDLTSAAFQELTSIEFRIYFDDRLNNSSSASDVFIDNLILSGSVSSIPEPSTYGLALGGLALAIAALRRRRKSA